MLFVLQACTRAKQAGRCVVLKYSPFVPHQSSTFFNSNIKGEQVVDWLIVNELEAPKLAAELRLEVACFLSSSACPCSCWQIARPA